jgi:uncharacterized membrane protein
MTLRPDVLLAIIGMALATYLCRAGGYALFRALRPPRYVEVVCSILPGPIFMAYAMPALAAHGWKGWVAAVAVWRCSISRAPGSGDLGWGWRHGGARRV